MEKEYAEHNRRYDRFFKYFYESIYRDKYYVMGDYDTMTIAFLLDTALYYFAAIMPIYRWSHERLGVPPFFEDGAEIGYYPIRFYNRRLVKIAQRKMKLGIYGNHNAGRRPEVRRLLDPRARCGSCSSTACSRWAKAELANAWTYVVKPRPLAKASADAPTAAGASSRIHALSTLRLLTRPVALVTGASSGIGLELATLARPRRPRPRPRRAPARPAREHRQGTPRGVRRRASTVIARDLARPATRPRAVAQEVEARGTRDRHPRQQRRARRLRPLRGTPLEQGARDDPGQPRRADGADEACSCPACSQRGRGRILNVASTAAFQPGPLMAVYYATKAYVLSFSEALANEIGGHGRHRHRALSRARRSRSSRRQAGIEETHLFRSPLVLDATTVALAGYRGMLRGKRRRRPRRSGTSPRPGRSAFTPAPPRDRHRAANPGAALMLRPGEPADRFAEVFGAAPTVSAEAPGRVNVIGEHTDYSGGFVFPAAIPLRCRVALAVRTGRTVRAFSENRRDDGILEYELGREAAGRGWIDYVQGLTRTLAVRTIGLPGFDLAVSSDIPPGAGLASSAALEVAILRALREAFALPLDDRRARPPRPSIGERVRRRPRRNHGSDGLEPRAPGFGALPGHSVARPRGRSDSGGRRARRGRFGTPA